MVNSLKPAFCKVCATTIPAIPAPTITTRGSRRWPGSVMSLLLGVRSSACAPAAERIAPHRVTTSAHHGATWRSTSPRWYRARSASWSANLPAGRINQSYSRDAATGNTRTVIFHAVLSSPRGTQLVRQWTSSDTRDINLCRIIGPRTIPKGDPAESRSSPPEHQKEASTTTAVPPSSQAACSSVILTEVGTPFR